MMGESAEVLSHSAMFGTRDALEVQRAAFSRGQQGADTAGGLRGGEVNHHQS